MPPAGGRLATVGHGIGGRSAATRSAIAAPSARSDVPLREGMEKLKGLLATEEIG
jgi:hypothetical protein